MDLSGNGFNLNDPATSTTLAALRCSRTGMISCGCGLGTNLAQGSLCQGIHVIAAPQSSAPHLSLGFIPPDFPAGSPWPILSGATCSLRISVSDGLVPDGLLPCVPLVVSAASDNPAMVSLPTNTLPDSYDQYPVNPAVPYTLMATGGGTSADPITITLTVTNEVGLSSSTKFTLSVVRADYGTDCVSTLCPNVDSNLLASLLVAAGETNGCVSPLDLLRLSGLSVSGANVSDSCAWQWLANLTSLNLVGGSISNVEFLTNLTQLTMLGLEDNRITDPSPLGALTNLNVLYLQQNLLSDLRALTNLAQLSFVDLSLNLLDTNGDLAVTAAIERWRGLGAGVVDGPQRAPPVFIGMPARWFIAANAASSLPFSITNNTLYGTRLSVRVTSSNTNLLPSEAVLVQGPDTNSNWLLLAIPTTNQTGAATLTLEATDDAGLTTEVTLQVVVMVPEVVAVADPSLLAAICSQLGKPAGDLASADLLNLIQLEAAGSAISDLSGLQWATNLTTLDLSDNSLSDLTFLEKLPQLTDLGLDHNRITDISPLAGLTNLNFLSLQHNLLTNVESLAYLPQLSSVDVSWNLLDTSVDSAAMTVIESLAGRGVAVDYLPQRAPPSLENRADWVISGNGVSVMVFYIEENGQPATSDLVLTAHSSNPSLVPDQNVLVGQANALDWFLTLTPATGQPGTNTITLSATNDAGLSASTTVLVDVILPLPLDDQFFGTADFSWQTGGDAPWFGQTDVTLNGVPVAQSGSIGDLSESWLAATVTGPGMLTFWWKVSSETDYDWLEFSVDGQVEGQISGEVAWQQEAVLVPAGTHGLNWRYSMDSDTSRGLAAAWLGQVSFVSLGELTMQANDTTKAYGTGMTLAGGAFTLIGTLHNGDSLTNVTLSSAGAAPGAPVGTYPIVASGAQGVGLSNYAITYVDGTLTVLSAASAGGVASSLNPSLPGQSASFTVSLQTVAPGAGTPTGTVQFQIDGTNAGGPVLLNGGTATFSTATLSHGIHVVVAEYAGDGNFIGTTNRLLPSQLVNTPPVAGPDTIERDPQSGAKVSIAALLSNDFDADGDTLAVAGVSATSVNGGTVVSNAGWVLYTPAAGFTNSDTFTYLLSDGWGTPVAGTVTVAIRADNGPPPNLAITDLGNGLYAIRGAGISGRTYRIEFADELQATNWQLLGTAAADVSGAFGLLDSSGPPQRFYRSVYP